MFEKMLEGNRKFINPYVYKLQDHSKLIIYEKEDIVKNRGKWKEVFGNNNPVFLEIGSGAGSFLSENAAKNRDKNYIGLEIRFKRIVFCARKTERRGVENIRFIREYGEEMETFLDKDEISGLYINFPDPWAKKKQLKKRIFQQSLFNKLNNVMVKGGKIFFKTDHYGYYMHVLELMKSVEGYKVVFHTDDLYNSEKIETNIATEFENLFVGKGYKINYIEIEKEV